MMSCGRLVSWVTLIGELGLLGCSHAPVRWQRSGVKERDVALAAVGFVLAKELKDKVPWCLAIPDTTSGPREDTLTGPLLDPPDWLVHAVEEKGIQVTPYSRCPKPQVSRPNGGFERILVVVDRAVRDAQSGLWMVSVGHLEAPMRGACDFCKVRDVPTGPETKKCDTKMHF